MGKFTLAVMAFLMVATGQAQTSTTPNLDGIVGHYRFKSGVIMSVAREGDAVTVKSTGQQKQTLAPAADGRFNYTAIPGYLTFDMDAKGRAKTLHFHYDERSLPATPVDAATAQKAADALALKIKNKTHDPACAVTLKRLIEEARVGKPDYDKMMLVIAQATRMQLPMLQQRIVEMGAVKEVKFTDVGPNGAEMFDVTFENGATHWVVFCLPNGYVSGIGIR